MHIMNYIILRLERSEIIFCSKNTIGGEQVWMPEPDIFNLNTGILFLIKIFILFFYKILNLIIIFLSTYIWNFTSINNYDRVSVSPLSILFAAVRRHWFFFCCLACLPTCAVQFLQKLLVFNKLIHYEILNN